MSSNRNKRSMLTRMVESRYSVLIVGGLAAILSFPPFIILYHFVAPIVVPIGGGFRIDHVLIFLTIFFALYLIITKMKKVIYVILLGGLLYMTFSSLFGGYGVRNLYHDYSVFLYTLKEDGVQLEFMNKKEKFTNEDRIRQAIDYKTDTVMGYARNIAVKHFDDYYNYAANRKIIQSFSVFKEIRKRWTYVHDPAFEEYYSTASESVGLVRDDGKLKGDCDDYSILVAACIKAIGGEVRLVRTTVETGEETTGHIYPEVKIGDQKDLEQVVYLIKEEFFERESKNKEVYYYVDSNGDVWLNFDYNDFYPGGKYQSKVRNSEIKI